MSRELEIRGSDVRVEDNNFVKVTPNLIESFKDEEQFEREVPSTKPAPERKNVKRAAFNIDFGRNTIQLEDLPEKTERSEKKANRVYRAQNSTPQPKVALQYNFLMEKQVALLKNNDA